MSDIGGKLRKIRLEKGLTMKDVADAAQIAQSSLSYIEKGVNSPSVCTLKAILDSLGISLQEFFAEPDNKAVTDTQTEQAHKLLEKLNSLPPRERKAVELLLGLDEHASVAENL